MEYYNSLLSAITENYPELEIDESKFSRLRCKYLFLYFKKMN